MPQPPAGDPAVGDPTAGVPDATGEAGERPLLLVVSTGPHHYREYVFAAIAARYRIHLINTVAPSWESPYLVGSTVVPTTELSEVSAAATAVAAREPVAGVLSWDEARVHQTAAVATQLGLPTSAPEAVWRCRDKLQSRHALAAAGLPQPAFELVGTAVEAARAALGLGYPVIVKPRAAAASYGVALAADLGELAEHFRFADAATVPHMPDYDQAVLVEEYLTGPEVSIDSVVHDGVVTPLFVGHKSVGFPPYFEETGHVVSHGDPLLADPAFTGLLQDVHTALGFTRGWTHAEFMLTPDGPKVIEVNARLGGDLIPYLGQLASGVQPGRLAADVACGVAPEFTVDRDLVAAVRFFYPDHDDTVIDEVAFDRAPLPAAIDRAVVLVGRGDRVSPPPRGLVSGRIAFATAVAATAQECTAALDEAAEALRVTEPAVADTR